MKELSIEEKVKRYDEAYKVAKNIHIFSSDLAEIKRMEEIFPELQKSEDERIRKALINGFNKLDKSAVWYNGITNGQILAWLEKQVEQKPVIEMKTPEESLGIDSDTYNKIVDECIYGEQKHTDNVEPKFHEGDWVVYNNNGCICQIKSIRENDYCLWPLDSDVEGYFKTTYIDNEYHLWTIQEAKEGDVLASNRSIFIFSQEYMAGKPEAHCGIMNGLFIVKPEGCWTNEKCYPATKEQCDTLMKAMADAGYTFDFDKKELKKIKQNNAWDEDGERIILAISQLLKDCESENGWNCVYSNDREVFFADMENWLKSFKDRVQPKQEWSKEDEVKINRIVACLENLNVADNDILLKDVDWLKSLRPQNRWKPSDEQMDALQYVYRNCNPLPSDKLDWDSIRTLELMYQDLKKLK